ncbi:MAG: hypothetical protein M0C28_28865 [Candidatus Moduliflexus flocculans]|nr:hypothetical protein [Candidatus Moduliflexus flocculans]
MKEGLTIPAQVNYVGKGLNLYELGYERDGSAMVVNGYMQMAYLWEKIRVQGGAYGGFSAFDDVSGVFTFSYRDLNVASTIENYDKAGAFLKGLDSSRLSDNELTKAIIAAIGELDAITYRCDGYTSMMRHLTNRTDALRQKIREDRCSPRTAKTSSPSVKRWKRPPSPMCGGGDRVTVRTGRCEIWD